MNLVNVQREGEKKKFNKFVKKSCNKFFYKYLKLLSKMFNKCLFIEMAGLDQFQLYIDELFTAKI